MALQTASPRKISAMLIWGIIQNSKKDPHHILPRRLVPSCLRAEWTRHVFVLFMELPKNVNILSVNILCISLPQLLPVEHALFPFTNQCHCSQVFLLALFHEVHCRTCPHTNSDPRQHDTAPDHNFHHRYTWVCTSYLKTAQLRPETLLSPTNIWLVSSLQNVLLQLLLWTNKKCKVSWKQHTEDVNQNSSM